MEKLIKVLVKKLKEQKMEGVNLHSLIVLKDKNVLDVHLLNNEIKDKDSFQKKRIAQETNQEHGVALGEYFLVLTSKERHTSREKEKLKAVLDCYLFYLKIDDPRKFAQELSGFKPVNNSFFEEFKNKDRVFS